MASNKNTYFRNKGKSSTYNKNNGIMKNFIGNITSIINDRLCNIKSISSSEYKDIDIMSQYGFVSCGFKGMKCQVIKNDNGCTIVGVYDKNRPKVGIGEVEIYTKDGTYIKLDNNGSIEISSINGVKIIGDLQVTGKVNGNNI